VAVRRLENTLDAISGPSSYKRFRLKRAFACPFADAADDRRSVLLTISLVETCTMTWRALVLDGNIFLIHALISFKGCHSVFTSPINDQGKGGTHHLRRPRIY
jgi:hypothetical protein